MNRCICGDELYSVFVADNWWEVTEEGETISVKKDDVLLGECTSCKLIRQIFPEKIDYTQYPPTSPLYKGKSYNHDFSVSMLRLERYQKEVPNIFSEKARSLDVGSGSGAFVDLMEEKLGWDSFGCEIAQYLSEKSKKIYRKPLIDIHFPTDHFKLVTVHDVLEHVFDPKEFMNEIFRITDEEGVAVIEIPDFYFPGYPGSHHWKTEHLWFFGEIHLLTLICATGFSVIKVQKPIEGKLSVICFKPKQSRKTILFPPGIGDCYWSLVKLRSFLKERGIGLPEVSVVSPRVKGHNAHQRAFPFLEMFPFLKSKGESIVSQDPKDKKIWNEAYLQEGRTVFEKVMGYDYFIAYNGRMRFGGTIEKADSLETEWDLPRFISLREEEYRINSIKNMGRYVVFYFVFHGIYRNWLKEMGGITAIVSIVRKLKEEMGITPVLVGASWDSVEPTLRELASQLKDISVNLSGQTELDELFGLLRGAELVVGYPSGLTIMSAVLGTKTVTIWNTYFHRDFWWNVVPPKTHGSNYIAVASRGFSVRDFLNTCLNFYRLGVYRIQTTESLESLPEKTHFVCVLRTGGVYHKEYVIKLYEAIRRNYTHPFEMICLTDLKDFEYKDIRVVSLKRNWMGWWSKLEIFRKDYVGPDSLIVYMDLDTLITGNINWINRAEVRKDTDDFWALLPWNIKRRNSGGMASAIMKFRSGVFSFIYENFNIDLMEEYPGGDQDFIKKQLEDKQIEYMNLKEIGGIFSYKKDILRGNRKGHSIVCFHGDPRIEALKGLTLVKENWRG